MAKKIGLKELRKVVESEDKWLLARQADHVKRVEKSVLKLQRDILNGMTRLRTAKSGELLGVRVNLKQAQKIHKDVVTMFERDFSAPTKKMVKEFSDVSTRIARSYRQLNVSAKFTQMDTAIMNTLQDGVWQDYLALSNTKKNQIVQAMYDAVISGGDMAGLMTQIEGALMGSEMALGRSLVAMARLYARDGIMIFNQEVNLYKAEQLEIYHYLYIGDIIGTTRDFCKRRVGKVYTKKQIESWTFRWAGKSGPPLTHRGGYNCRHSWRPVKPEWMEGEKRVPVADWNLEQRRRG
jgi:hypothetical protein